MSSSTTSSSSVPTTSTTTLNPADYSHSPVHHAVIIKDHKTLTRILTQLPKLADPTRIRTEHDSLAQELIADNISGALDRRDVPNRETPLHLAVRLNDHFAVKSLAVSGADISLQNSNGWNPLQESLCRKLNDIAVTLVRHHHISAWAKWRRRLPRLISVLRRMRDFYMEISFHFESSVIPFVNKIAPSDTYKLWKRDGNLRADTTLAGFDGLKIQRADQSFLFLGDGDETLNVGCGSLLVLNRDERKIFDAFENAGGEMSDADVAGFCAQTSVYRPGMDVTRAELVSRTNWRRQDKVENVGEWKAKVYELHNVLFSFRSRKVVSGVDVNGNDLQQVLPLEFDEDDDGFLVAENPRFSVSSTSNQRRHSSFVREEREFVSVGRKSVDIIPSRIAMSSKSKTERRGGVVVVGQEPVTKEKEFVKSLRPCVWLTDQFPLKTEELLPLLDILANKVKAVRRMRELLTTKFPAGTFPVKVAIPVVPTVRVVITFTKFVELQPTEQFFTPLSSPRLLGNVGGHGGSSDDDQKSETRHSWFSSSSSSSSSSAWLRRSTSSRSGSAAKDFQRCASSSLAAVQESDPFAIPAGYSWSSIDDKSRSRVKKCKSSRKSK